MLDKSIPCFRVIMRRPANTPITRIELPQGYSIRSYQENELDDWADIETSVGEFDTTEESRRYFIREFLPYPDKLPRRVYFLYNAAGEKIGTISAWWLDHGKNYHPLLHWVAIKPDYQGQGLGRPLINFGIRKLIEIEGDLDIYLRTQTWSHRAIALYLLEGFQFIKKPFAGYQNDYFQAIRVLKDKIGKYLLNRGMNY